MFFFHERTKKINMWAFSFIVGPFLAPFCSAFLNEVIDWRASFGVLAALYALSTIILVLAGDETLYDRGNPTTRQRGVIGKVKLLIGVTGFQEASKTTRPTLLSVSKRLLRLGLYPNVFAVSESARDLHSAMFPCCGLSNFFPFQLRGFS